MLVLPNEFRADTELLFQGGEPRLGVPLLGSEVSGFNSELVQVTGGIRRSVISRQYDQRVFQADVSVYISQQVGQGTVQSQQVVFHFEAGGPEYVPDVVGGRKTNGQVVRNGVLAELFAGDQGLGEIQGQFIADRADRQQGGVILAIRRAERMREYASIAPVIDFPGLVIGGAEQVSGFIVKQRP